MIDYKCGAEYRILDETNGSYSDEKSPAGKTDCYTMGAGCPVFRALRLKEENA
jgi:hypothetical protein